MVVVKSNGLYSLLSFLPASDHCLSLYIALCLFSSSVLAFILASLLIYVSRFAASTVLARKATIASVLTSGSVFASVSAFTLASVSPRAESGVLTFTWVSASPSLLACRPQNQIAPWSSNRPVCFAVSRALHLIGCQCVCNTLRLQLCKRVSLRIDQYLNFNCNQCVDNLIILLSCNSVTVCFDRCFGLHTG